MDNKDIKNGLSEVVTDIDIVGIAENENAKELTYEETKRILRSLQWKRANLEKATEAECEMVNASRLAVYAKKKELGIVKYDVKRFVREGRQWPFESVEERLLLSDACMGALEWANREPYKRIGEVKELVAVQDLHLSNFMAMKNDLKRLDEAIEDKKAKLKVFKAVMKTKKR